MDLFRSSRVVDIRLIPLILLFNNTPDPRLSNPAGRSESTSSNTPRASQEITQSGRPFHNGAFLELSNYLTQSKFAIKQGLRTGWCWGETSLFLPVFGHFHPSPCLATTFPRQQDQRRGRGIHGQASLAYGIDKANPAESCSGMSEKSQKKIVQAIVSCPCSELKSKTNLKPTTSAIQH